MTPRSLRHAWHSDKDSIRKPSVLLTVGRTSLMSCAVADTLAAMQWMHSGESRMTPAILWPSPVLSSGGVAIALGRYATEPEGGIGPKSYTPLKVPV